MKKHLIFFSTKFVWFFIIAIGLLVSAFMIICAIKDIQPTIGSLSAFLLGACIFLLYMISFEAWKANLPKENECIWNVKITSKSYYDNRDRIRHHKITTAYEHDAVKYAIREFKKLYPEENIISINCSKFNNS